MNNKHFLIILAIFFLLFDLSLSGRFDFFRNIFFFPALMILFSIRLPLDAVIVPSVLYGFLYDISIGLGFPVVTLIMVCIIFISYFLKEKLLNSTNQALIFVFYLFVSVLIALATISFSTSYLDLNSSLAETSKIITVFTLFFPVAFLLANKVEKIQLTK